MLLRMGLCLATTMVGAISGCELSQSYVEPQATASAVKNMDFADVSLSTDLVTPSRPNVSRLPDDVLVYRALSRSSIIGAARGAQLRLTMFGLPKNSRQVPEGYWLGALPSAAQIEELYARGIRLIVTATSIPPPQARAIRARIEDLGMTQINIPFGGKFPNPSRFCLELEKFGPHQIYIHCEHGGDRTGALLAFLLITQHGWSTVRAFLAVAFPGPNDSRALIELLKLRGYEVTQSDIDEFLGIYSPETNGGFGGLKVRGQGYVRLVNTTIDAIKRFE